MINFDDFIPCGLEEEEEEEYIPTGGDNGRDMFDTYDSHNPNEIPDNMHPKKKCNCHCGRYMINAPHILRYTDGKFRGYTWYYGQSLTLEFGFNPEKPMIDHDGNLFTLGEYLKDKAITFTIYNFRMEEMASNTVPSTEELKRIFIDIDAKLSETLVKGTYYIKVEAMRDNLDNGDVEEFSNRFVMINPSDLILLVK